MKRLWIQLSFAFSFVLILSQLVSFLTLLGLAYFTPTVFVGDIQFPALTYREVVELWVSDQLFAGATAEEIEQQYNQQKDGVDINEVVAQVQTEIAEVEALTESNEGEFPFYLQDFIWSSSGSVTITSTKTNPAESADIVVLDDSGNHYATPANNLPFALFFNSSTIRVLVQSLIIGVIAGIFTSRLLVKPLNRLIEAVQAFGRRDMSQRVQVKGSREIEELMITFNNMADELEKAEQLRLNIFADVSHELRTPLAGLEGSLRASLDHVYELDEQQIANMVVQTQHLTHLVEDLRLLAQAEAHTLALEMEATDVKQLVQDTVDMFAVQAEESGVELTAVLPTPSPTINMDINRVRQVLHNLISNALRHTPENGRIEVKVESIGDDIQFTVKDTGEGIGAEHLPYVFDRFYRTDKSRSRDQGGTGLGLAITKALVEAHYGEIEVISEGLGKGSLFCFSIPNNILKKDPRN